MGIWITVDGDPYETCQGIVHRSMSWAKAEAKKLRKQHPTKKVEIWEGWIIK
jgi:hypothetical protein